MQIPPPVCQEAFRGPSSRITAVNVKKYKREIKKKGGFIHVTKEKNRNIT
jgi:hypothetical protein